MILLDTTVLVYASGGEHPLRDPCRRLVEAGLVRPFEFGTTVEVIQEFAHIRSHRRSRQDAAGHAREAMGFLELLPSYPSDVESALDLFSSLPRLGSFDCLLAAVALNRGAEALVSADRAFGGVPGLRWVDPGGPELAALLSR